MPSSSYLPIKVRLIIVVIWVKSIPIIPRSQLFFSHILDCNLISIGIMISATSKKYILNGCWHCRIPIKIKWDWKSSSKYWWWQLNILSLIISKVINWLSINIVAPFYINWFGHASIIKIFKVITAKYIITWLARIIIIKVRYFSECNYSIVNSEWINLSFEVPFIIIISERTIKPNMTVIASHIIHSIRWSANQYSININCLITRVKYHSYMCPCRKVKCGLWS